MAALEEAGDIAGGSETVPVHEVGVWSSTETGEASAEIRGAC